MRKLALPLLAVFAVLAVSAPAAQAITAKGVIAIVNKALAPIKDVNAGQTKAITDVDTRVDTVVKNLAALSSKLDAILAVATDSLTKLQAGLVSVAQQTAAAAGTGDPNSTGTKTAETATVPGVKTETLPGGTLYRQIVLSTGARAPVPAGAPIGARTWVKMPDVAALSYSNTWVCTSAGTSPTGLFAGYAVTCTGGTT